MIDRDTVHLTDKNTSEIFEPYMHEYLNNGW